MPNINLKLPTTSIAFLIKNGKNFIGLKYLTISKILIYLYCKEKKKFLKDIFLKIKKYII